MKRERWEVGAPEFGSEAGDGKFEVAGEACPAVEVESDRDQGQYASDRYHVGDTFGVLGCDTDRCEEVKVELFVK